MNIHPLRPRDHEDAARVAISCLTERHRKGWRNTFEALLDLRRPEVPPDGWQLDDDGMIMLSINAGEWLIARGDIHARGGPREINAYLLGQEGPFLTSLPGNVGRRHTPPQIATFGHRVHRSLARLRILPGHSHKRGARPTWRSAR